MKPSKVVHGRRGFLRAAALATSGAALGRVALSHETPRWPRAISADEARVGYLMGLDNLIDPELWQWCPDDVSLYIARLQVAGYARMDEEAVELAMSSGPVIERAMETIASLKPQVTVFGCTSASFVGGLAHERAIRGHMQRSGAANPVTITGSVIAALRALKAQKIAVASPYPHWLAERLRRTLVEAEFQVVSFYVDEVEEIGTVSVADAYVEDLAARTYRSGVDAMFLSCSGLETRHLLEPLSAKFPVPIVTSVQATMWAALGLAGRRIQSPSHPLNALLPERSLFA